MSRTITPEFKQQLLSLGRELEVNLVGNNIDIYGEDINSISMHYEGNILKSVMKQLDIDCNVNIPVGTRFEYYIDIKTRNQQNPLMPILNYDDVDMGGFFVYSSEYQEDTNSYKIVCYDKMLYAMKDYENLNITYPITVREYISALCNHIGLYFNANQTFTNYDKQILSEPYLQYNEDTEQWESLGYTYRDVFDELAQITASTICIDGDTLKIRYITDSQITIDENYMKDINVKFGEMTKPINTVTFKRSADSDVISVSYPSNLPDDEKNEIVIRDNQILNGNNRDEFIDGILERLNGLTYCINDFSSTGIIELDLCDKYYVSITQTDSDGNTNTNTYTCVMFNDEINVNQGLEENVYTNMPEDSTTDYTKSDTTDRRINQTYLIVDKQNQQIQSVVSQTSEQNSKIAQLTQTVSSLESQISDVADLTTSGETTLATLTLTDINESEPVSIKIYPIGSSITNLYPYSGLYPSSTTYLKSRKIKFHNSTTNEDFYYELPDDLLYYDSENFDEFNLDYSEQTCTITKKCEYDSSGNVVLKSTPVTNSYTYPIIALTDGDYTISLQGYTSGYIFARLLTENLYTDQFYTKAETDSKISQTANSINLSVDTKLSNYSTTNEMNSAISLKANEITSSVNNTLTNYSTTTQMNSAITQKANEITSEVAETYATQDDTATLSSRINQTAKNISLSVNNGSTSSGITITTTKEDGTTATTSGNIQMTGLVKFTDLSTSGSTTINGSNITTGTINGNNVNVTNINANNITSGTISANKINGGTITASAINLGSGKFKVSTAGAITSTSGTIGGWSISSSKLRGLTGQSGVYGAIRPYGVQLENSSGTVLMSAGWGDVINASTSDKTLKNNINKIDDKLEKFYDDLKPITFYFNEGIDEGKKHIGFVAQDILESQDKINEDLAMVKEEKMSKKYLLNKQEIIALNTWQIQKLKEEIKLLKEEINNLKKERESDK